MPTPTPVSRGPSTSTAGCDGPMLSAKKPMRRVLSVTLFFEVIVFGLAVPVMYFVSSVPMDRAALLGGAAAVLALVSAALLRSPVGYVLGWITQLLGIALGFATPAMFAVGGMFAAIWVLTVILGRRLDVAHNP
jgi:hypothetical protein